MSFLDRALGGVRMVDNFKVVPPLDGGWSLTPMDNLLRGITHHKETVSLELFARQGVVSYMMRAWHGEAMGGVLHSYFPQARIDRRVDDGVAELDNGDWLFLDEDEHALVLPLYLKDESFLPLRIYDDRTIETSKVDPLAGVIGMLSSATRAGGEGAGDRLGLRLVIHPAREDWNAPWRDKIQKRRDGDDKNSFAQLSPSQREQASIPLMCAIGGLAAWGVGNVWLYMQGGVPYLIPFNLGSALLGVGGGVFLTKTAKKAARPYIDEQLVEDKLKSPAFKAEVQVVRVFRHPADQGAAEEQIAGLVDCLRSHDDPVGNSLQAGKSQFYRGEDCFQGKSKHPFVGGSQLLAFLSENRAAKSILSSREVAALWHPPLGMEEMASMERSAGGVLRPYLLDLAAGGDDAGPLVGLSESGDDIRLPEAALRKHSLILGKSGVGKSTMVKHIIAYKLERKAAGRDNSAVVVIDPHADLVRDILKMVPPSIAHKVRLLDFGRQDRVPGINLVDPRLFPDRDRCVDTIITTVKALWEHWGGRLEDLLKRSLSIIYEFNRHPDTKPEDMLTMLDILQLLDEVKQVGQGRDARNEASDYQRFILSRVEDPSLLEWFNSYLGWGRETRSEAVGPVHSRVGAYAADARASVVMGQQDSTIMLSDVLQEGLVLLVSTAAGSIGTQPAALMGGTMVSLVESALRDQESLDPSKRAKCLLVADEFQTITGANWEGMLAEIRKYGCSLMLATQSLARLDTPERKLKAGILGNVGVMVGYNMSADDAHILAAEMDDERVQPRTFVNLHPHHCCVRITSDTKCYPAFTMRTLPPPDLVRGSLDSEEAVLAASLEYTVDCAEAREKMREKKWRRMNLDKVGGMPGTAPPGLVGSSPPAAPAGGPVASAPPAARQPGNSAAGPGPEAPRVAGLMDRFGPPRPAAPETAGGGGLDGSLADSGGRPVLAGVPASAEAGIDPVLVGIQQARAQREARFNRGPLRGVRMEDVQRSQLPPEILEQVAGLPSNDPALRALTDKRLGDQVQSEKRKVRAEVERELSATREALEAERSALAAERERMFVGSEVASVDAPAEPAEGNGSGDAVEPVNESVGSGSAERSRDVSLVRPAARQPGRPGRPGRR